MTGSSYRDIAADLRSQIESGQLSPGARLPTETELAQRYGVQRNIARLALAELVADGLVTRRRRAGTFVRDRDPVRVPFSVYQRATDPDRDATLGPWETACAQLGIAGRTELVDVSIVPAAGRVAEYLQLHVGEDTVCRERHMWADDTVAMIQHAYMPRTLVEGTPLAGTKKVIGGAHAAFAALGIIPDLATFWAVARLPSGAERELLGLGRGMAVQEVWRVAMDVERRPIELLHWVADAQMAILVMDELPLRRDQ